MQTTILKGVHIGNNVIIGANSLVNKDIPDNCVAAGNPCKVIMSLEEYHEKRKAAQVDEATELVKLYRERYGKEPDEHALHEFFWLSASIINVITNAALIPSLLQNGAVVASVISEFVTNAIQFIYMKKKVKFNVNWKSLITGAFSTAVMSVCVLGLMLLKLPNTIGLIVEVGCGALVYIAINLMMKNALMFEMIQKLKTKLLHKA